MKFLRIFIPKSRSRSADVDRRRINGSRIISSNHPSHDSDVSSMRTWRTIVRTASPANPDATENARTEARLLLSERREESVSNTAGRVLLIIPQETIRDAHRAAVQQLARVIISEQHITNDNNSDCSICWDPYQLGEAARVMQCGHRYHETCIFTWLESKRTCPLCRYKMP